MLTKQQIEEIHQWVDDLESLWAIYYDNGDPKIFDRWKATRTEFHKFLYNLK